MIVVSIVAILATIAVPSYLSAIRSARIQKAKEELRVISGAIDMHRAQNGSRLPLTLHEVGHGDRLDPWGVPYCYLNYEAGTGDGLDWALEAGLLDPSAVFLADAGAGSGGSAGAGGSGGGSSGGSSAGGGAGGGGGGGAGGSGGSGLGAVGAPGIGGSSAVDLSSGPGRSAEAHLRNVLRGSRGRKRAFIDVPVPVVRRSDRYLFPLNSDYDLFSLGPDSRTAVSLGAPMAMDDVIRANDGGYFGLASKY